MQGILPANRERRAEALERKRREYKESVAKHYRTEESSEADQAVLRQIRLDIPRTATDIPRFREPVVQKVH